MSRIPRAASAALAAAAAMAPLVDGGALASSSLRAELIWPANQAASLGEDRWGLATTPVAPSSTQTASPLRPQASSLCAVPGSQSASTIVNLTTLSPTRSPYTG
jgi:hypothetical protein